MPPAGGAQGRCARSLRPLTIRDIRNAGFSERAMSAQPIQAAARNSDGNLKSLVKIVRVLDCFSANQRALSLAEICQLTGYPKSTTHRLLASMREVGFLDQGRERDRYRLGLKLFELGNIVLANLEIHREARSIVEALRRITGQVIHLAIFDGRQAVVIHRADPSPDAATVPTMIENAPVHCTSVGKAILAWQPEEVIERVIAMGLTRYTEATITDPDGLRQELEQIRARASRSIRASTSQVSGASGRPSSTSRDGCLPA